MNENTLPRKIEPGEYYRSEWWRIAGFSLCCIAANLYDTLISFITYYLTGYVGVGVILATSILMYMRIWDGITDPVVGWMIDRTNGKFGKVRPFIAGGGILMVVSTYFMIFHSHRLPGPWKLPFFILMYLIYIVGFTAQDSAVGAGQTCLTNDPKQRPMIGFWISLFITIRITFLILFLVQVLVPRNGGFTVSFFQEAWLFITVLVVAFSVIAILCLRSKDVPEFYERMTGTAEPHYRLSEYIDVLKHNRPLQMIILSTSSDALALTSFTNAGVGVALYGIVCGNYALNGQIRLFTFIPCIFVLLFGVQRLAKRFGMKSTYVFGSALGAISCLCIILLFYLGDPTTLMFPTLSGFKGWTLFTVLFLLFSVGQDGAKLVTNVSAAMNADVIDYELSRSGRYIGGMLTTMCSFVRKFATTLGTAIYGFLCARIGFVDALPDVGTPLLAEDQGHRPLFRVRPDGGRLSHQSGRDALLRS